MWRLSILAGVFATTVSTGVPPAPVPDAYASAVVMFGAHWCAPCMGEVRRLSELADAASPDRIVLAWIDHPIAPLPTTTTFISLTPEVARRLARKIEGQGYGLPFSVMIDSRGNVCAIRRSLLAPNDIAGMRVRCAATN